jgi:predicted transcriptional regulator of viral defense system
MEKLTVKRYVDRLQSRGQYTFLKKEVQKNIDSSNSAITLALNRLSQKNRIVMIRQGFYIIIPLEYAQAGILPPEWFIQPLMEYAGQPYYVGLLSAAAIHGASHQQPQEFQVCTNRPLRTIRKKGLRIKFFKKSNMNWQEGQIQVKTENGYMNASDPETTAIDLVRYLRSCGGLNHVATVLSELSEKITPGKLVEAAQREKSLVYLQRLGFILDQANAPRLSSKLHHWLERQKTLKMPLDPNRSWKDSSLNKKWNIFNNTTLEMDVI